ncbi:hypothetical protein SSS_09654 [Sarcoptes scabiei]|nr:hypothetical protein SSS_09654 [Sarcoptes scabiei]
MIRTTFLLLIIVSLLSNSIAKINCRRKCEWVCNGEDDDDNDYGENDSKGSGDSKEHKGSKRSGGAGGSTVSVGSSSSGGWSGFEEYGDSMKIAVLVDQVCLLDQAVQEDGAVLKSTEIL